MNLLSLPKGVVRLAVNQIADARERRKRDPLYSPLHSNLDAELHLRETADWLRRAQDFGTDRGISYGCVFGEGFLPSYPETTGYIIPTFLDLAKFRNSQDDLQRAIAAGEWEADVQMDCGAVMGGMYNTNPTPAIFNTGMVLLGWAALYRETGADRFADAGRRACEWLIECQEPDGNWIKGNSEFANNRSTVYNVKAAWGLAEMGDALGEARFIDAAVKNAEYAMSRQQNNGWFDDCCLDDPVRPLLHTIAYTMQGLVGIGKLTGRQDMIDAARRTGVALRELMDSEGFIPGRIDRTFQGAARWCCLTGSAQTSMVWSELEHLDGDSSFGAAADQVNRYLMARHDVSNSDPSIRGGVPGSWPVWGSYGRHRILNWATKFFADALLMRLAPELFNGTGRGQ